jgi:outer membrane receptor protein involved in Fe transport
MISRVPTTAAIGLVTLAHFAFAGEPPIEEVVVTAELRRAPVADLPNSISVLEPNDPRGTVVQQLEQILGAAPNVNYASGASRARFLQIRGIGERGQFVEPLNSSVGVLLDGVDLSGVGTAATMFDVDRVEVFRGPQGTLYGANAIGGLVNVVTNRPTETLAVGAQLDAGDYDARGAGGWLSGPITETVRARLAAQYYADDGWMDNVHLDRDDTSDHRETTLRAALEWEPSDQTLWSLALGWVELDNGYDAFSLDNDRRTRSDEPGADGQRTTYASLRLDSALTEGLRIQGSLGFAHSDLDYGYDEDWTFTGFHPDGYTSTDRYRRDRDTTTLDLRLLSGPGTGIAGIEWVAGVFVLRQDERLRRSYTFAVSDLVSDYDADRIALYGEAVLPLTDRSRLVAGLRVERHESGYDDTEGVSFAPRDDLWGGRLVFEHDTASGRLVYAGVTRGYKAGGFNTDGSLDPSRRTFDPEHAWNFEAGYKGAWFDGRLSGRAAAFYMLRDDMQIDTSFEVPVGGGAVEFIEFQDNAAEGVNYGAELEAELRPIDRLALFASVGLLHAELEDYVNGAGDDLDGRDQAHAPGYTFFAGAEFDLTSRFFLRVEVEGKDRFYFSNSDAFQSDRYTVWNAVLGWRTDRWNVRLWGRNLTDEDYFVRGYGFGNDPRNGYAPGLYTQLGEPRRAGVSVTFEI